MIVAMEKKLISELIDGYKSCTCLWRTKDPDYKNKDVKNEAYESLLQLIKKYNENFTMEDLKRKIANLRTCYLREFKKVMDAKRYGGVYGPSLWYYKSLEFLNDQHQGEDRGVWLVRSCNSDDNYESNETPPVLVYEDHAEDTDDPCSPEPERPQSMAGGTTVDATAAPVRLQQGNNRPPPKKRRRVLDVLAGPSSCAAAADGHYEPQQVSYAAAAVDYYEPQVVGGVGVDPAEPPVADYYDGFGRYAANELRQMDWQSVIIAKRLVNEVLFLGQMGKLTVDTRIETPPPPPGTRKNGGDRDACSSPIPSVELMETS